MPDWSREFDVPIVLDDGRQLITLREAGEYIRSLPAKEQKQAHWQLAAAILLGVAERRDLLMHADIAMRKALTHDMRHPRRP